MDLGGRKEIANPERRAQQAICMGLDLNCLRSVSILRRREMYRDGLQNAPEGFGT
jgi:hypothetical protein